MEKGLIKSIRQEKFSQKIMGKTNKCNIQEDEALPGIMKKYKSTFLFSFLKQSPNQLFSRHSFFLLFLILLIKR